MPRWASQAQSSPSARKNTRAAYEEYRDCRIKARTRGRIRAPLPRRRCWGPGERRLHCCGWRCRHRPDRVVADAIGAGSTGVVDAVTRETAPSPRGSRAGSARARRPPRARRVRPRAAPSARARRRGRARGAAGQAAGARRSRRRRGPRLGNAVPCPRVTRARPAFTPRARPTCQAALAAPGTPEGSRFLQRTAALRWAGSQNPS